jgi:hypothetical protein
MAILGATALTFADWAKRLDDNYRISTIIELLSQTNEILEDLMVVEGNLPTGHKTTVRTALPQATWRLLNQGVPNAKSTTAQITDTCGNLETYSVIDKDIADLNGNTAEFRLSEVKAFLEGMSQQVSSTLFYGNQFLNPERFTGFAPRYSTVTSSAAATAANVLDAGGTGSTNTSIWGVVWGSEHLPGLPRPLQVGDRPRGPGLALQLPHRQYRRDRPDRRQRGEPNQPPDPRRLSLAHRSGRHHRCPNLRYSRGQSLDGPVCALRQPRGSDLPRHPGREQDQRPASAGGVERQADHNLPWGSDPNLRQSSQHRVKGDLMVEQPVGPRDSTASTTNVKVTQ